MNRSVKKQWGRHMLACGLLVILTLSAVWVEAQTDPSLSNEPATVSINLGEPEERDRAVEALRTRSQARRRAAEAIAQSQGIPSRGVTRDGSTYQLIKFVDHQPYYYVTFNINAGISTATDLVRNTPPYNLNGAGLIAGVWDSGAVRPTHQEFGGRVVVQDGSSNDDHATHVGGTIGASGVDADALGMAPSVTIHSYHWDDDIAEMTSRAATGPDQGSNIYVSNHSYGFLTGWDTGDWSGTNGPHWFGNWGEREDRGFGRYDVNAREWDELGYNAPYYLPFVAAGNDRNDTAPSAGTTFYFFENRRWRSKEYDPDTDPFDDGHKNGGYNTIGYQGVSKNVMTVGGVNDAVSGGARDLGNATMAPFSCWGPADDGRIKPDIVANGVGLRSPLAGSNSAYGNYSGTSMASPNAAGSALLLMEHYRNHFPNDDMLSSTLKGLIIHTADDLGNPGPDYRFGWGLMNTKAAADHITAHADMPGGLHIVEDELTTAEPMRTFSFTANDEDPIRVTLVWTDPPGPAQTGLNVTTPVLVNDLDVRLIGPGGSPTYAPYILDPMNPGVAATTGDNTLDNVEQVYIAEPDEAGTYTIEVSHKGTLTDDVQRFSLFVSGQTTLEYTLTYTAGTGGSIDGDSSQIVEHGEDGSSVEAIAATGYHFVEWSDGVTDNPRTDTEVTGDIIVEAEFAPNTYEVSFSAQGGATPDPVSKTVTYDASYGTLANTSRTGYAFDGWFTAPTGGAQIVDTSIVETADDHTLYAQWTANTYDVDFDAQGGSTPDPLSKTVTYDEAYGTLANTSRTGYAFDGWFTAPTGGAQIVDTSIVETADDHTLYAQWTINTYTLTYTAGTGGWIDGDSPQFIAHGSDGATVEAVPDPGYDFVQWSDGVTTASRTDTNVTGDITVEAQFSTALYSLTYTAGTGGSIDGDASQLVEYGADGSQVTAVPDTGHHFVQWSDGVTTASRTDTNVTDDVAVEAQFFINEYTLTYTAGTGGSIDGDASQTVEHGADGSQVTAVPDTGYQFVQWSDGVDVNPRTDTNVTGDITVEAQFSTALYSLVYTAGAGGSIDGDASQMVEYSQDGSPVTAVPDTGYHFVQWSDGITDNPRTDTEVTDDITVEAEFAPNPYEVSFNPQDGATPDPVSKTVTYSEPYGTLATTSRTGYAFEGWFTAAVGGTQIVDTTIVEIADNHTLYAQWTIHTYALDYTAGTGGSIDGDASQTVEHGADGSQVTAVPDTGYHFVEWSDGVTTASRTDTNVTENMSITAEFEIREPLTIAIVGPDVRSTSTGPVEYEIVYTGAETITLASSDVALHAEGTAAAGQVTVSGTGSRRSVVINDITGNGALSISIAPGTAVDSEGASAPGAGPSTAVQVRNDEPLPMPQRWSVTLLALLIVGSVMALRGRRGRSGC